MAFEIMSASTFFDADGETHDASHWQLSASCDDWETLAYESWKQHQNIYYNEDLQAGDDLTDDEVLALTADSDYCIRVRYRDSSLGWSEWSEPLAFHTAGGSASDTNLLLNPGAEDGTNARVSTVLPLGVYASQRRWLPPSNELMLAEWRRRLMGEIPR